MDVRWIVVVVAVAVAAAWLRLSRASAEPFADCPPGFEARAGRDALPASVARLGGTEDPCPAVRAGTPLRFEITRRPEDTVLAVHAELMYACLTVPLGTLPKQGPAMSEIRGPTSLSGWPIFCGDKIDALVLRRILVAHDADPASFDVRIWSGRPTEPKFALFAICAPSSTFAANAANVEALHVITPSCDRAKLAALVPFSSVAQSGLPGANRGKLTLCMDCLLYGPFDEDAAPAAANWLAGQVSVRPEQKAAYAGTFPLDGRDPRGDSARTVPPPHPGAPASLRPSGPIPLRNAETSSTGFRTALLDQSSLPGVFVLQVGDRLTLERQSDASQNGDWYVTETRDGVASVANAVVLRLPRQDAAEIEERGVVSDLGDEDVRVEISHAMLASSAHPVKVEPGLPVRIREIDFYGKVDSVDGAKAVLRGKQDEDARDIGNVSGLLFRCFAEKGVAESDCPDDLWDRPCVTHSECPFYMANRNYANDRGGCVAGYCEMPLGIDNLTFRNPRPGDRPMCYNCPSEDDHMDCCEKQREMNLYQSPDYAFPNDAEARRNALGPTGPGARMRWHGL